MCAVLSVEFLECSVDVIWRVTFLVCQDERDKFGWDVIIGGYNCLDLIANITFFLPHINNGSAGITIDGFTQPGASVNTDPIADNAVRMIELVGTGISGVEGLIIDGSNNVVRGLNIHRFKRGIRIDGAQANHNQIIGNLIGLMPDGSLDPTYVVQVSAPCIAILNGASSNRVGMPGSRPGMQMSVSRVVRNFTDGPTSVARP